MSVTCNPSIKAGTTKSITPDGASQIDIGFTQYDRSTSSPYSATSTPAVSEAAADELTPGSGTINLDLTALNDPLGGTAITLSGKKIVYAQFKAPTTNVASVKVKTGASNGYVLNHSEGVWVEPGCTVGLELKSGLSNVDGTHKILDIVGTNAGDKLQYVIVAG